MCLTAAFAGGIGAVGAVSYPGVFMSFNTFGAIALTFLLCNVLLAEARETHEKISYPSWWEPMNMVFLGVFFVICSDVILPN